MKVSTSRVVSVCYSQDEILQSIMSLHNSEHPFECDPTFSTGRFYKHLPEPRFKYDLNVQVPGVEQADARHLPLADASVSSLIFDPPFVMKDPKRRNGHLGVIESRFGGYGSASELYGFYQDALTEFWRVLAPSGLLVVKSQDTVSGGKQYWSHVEVYRMATALGFRMIDLFVLVARSLLWSPNMAHQQHARKAHSYFLCFRKPRHRGVVARRPVVESERGQAA